MKLSGSHIVDVSSGSWTVLREKEKQVIIEETRKLLYEGKHVINIIYGNPTTLLGTITKSITFLWEADSESPEYLKAEKRKQQEREYQISLQKHKELERQTAPLELEIYELEKRIKDVELKKLSFIRTTSGKMIIGTIILFTILLVVYVSINGWDDSPALLIFLGTISLYLLSLVVWGKKYNKQKREDTKNIDHLKQELATKKAELRAFKNSHNI